MPFPSHPFKICSQCQTPAEPDAPLCEQCGRVFPAQTSSAMYANRQPATTEAPRSKSGRRAMIVVELAFVAILSYAGYRYQTATPDLVAEVQPPAQYSAALGQHSAANPTHASSSPSHGAAKGHAPANRTPNPQFQHKGL